MQFDEYQREALKTDRVAAPQYRATHIEKIVPMLGIAGESGELLSEFKKSLRDGGAHTRFAERMTDELGDILWYVSNAASKFGLSLEVIAQRNLEKVFERFSKRDNEGCYLFDAKYPKTERLPASSKWRFGRLEPRDITKFSAYGIKRKWGII